MSKFFSEEEYAEIFAKIAEGAAGMEPPNPGQAGPGQAAPPPSPGTQAGDGVPAIGKEAFDELEKQASETSNILATQQGILEAILSETQSMHQTIRDAMG